MMSLMMGSKRREAEQRMVEAVEEARKARVRLQRTVDEKDFLADFFKAELPRDDA